MKKTYNHTPLPNCLLRNLPQGIFDNVLNAIKRISDNPLLRSEQRTKHYQMAFLDVDTLRRYTIWHMNNMPQPYLRVILNTGSLFLDERDNSPAGVAHFFSEKAKIPDEQTHALYEEEFDHVVQNVIQEYPSLQQAILLIDNIIRSYISALMMARNSNDNSFILNTEHISQDCKNLADSMNKSLTKEFLTSFLHFVPIGDGYTFDKDAYETGFRTLMRDRSMMRSLSASKKPRICPFSRTIQDYFNTEILIDNDGNFTLGEEKEGALLSFTANFIAEADQEYREKRREIEIEIERLDALYIVQAL